MADWATLTIDSVLLDPKIIDTWAKECAYNGYNPLEFFNLLKTKAASKGRSVSQFKEDIMKICVWFLMRGSKMTGMKITARTKALAKSGLETLIAVYDIKGVSTDARPAQSQSTQYSNEDVTIPRIAACFPKQCCQIIIAGAGRTIGEIPVGLPYYLAWSGGASLIPKTEKDMFNLWRQWQRNFDAVINNPASGVGPGGVARKATDQGQLDQYALAVWNSPIYNDKDRVKILHELQVFEGSKPK